MIRIGYPLSESVAPPGTAWGAEGLRGNEANENKAMVLVPAPARKGQSGSLFAQEDMACQVSGVRAPARSDGKARVHEKRSALGGALAGCVRLLRHVESDSKRRPVAGEGNRIRAASGGVDGNHVGASRRPWVCRGLGAAAAAAAARA